jgi:FixJ family two-component response regulator
MNELTARELQVLTLIAQSYSSKAVAQKLGIAFKTVVCHRAHIMAKLDIHELATLVRYAVRQNLIEA